MRISALSFVAAILLATAPRLVHAAESTTQVYESALNWGSIHGGVFLANQGGGNSLSGSLRYTPEFFFAGESLQKRLSIGLNLGLGVLHNAKSAPFLVIEYGAFINYQFIDRLSGRLLGGGQTWTAGNGTAAFVGAELFYHFRFPKDEGFAWLDRLYVSYTPVFKPVIAHEFGVGVGVQL